MHIKSKLLSAAAAFFLALLIGTTAYAAEITPKSAETIASMQTSLMLFPISISEEIQNGYKIITKTYALSEDESPADIDMSDFLKQGVSYVFSDAIIRESREDDKIEFAELVEIVTPTDKISDIIAGLSPYITYEKDGYKGILTLDISSITCEPEGYKTSTYELTEERTVRNLATQDTSVFDKSITVSGRKYTLKNVNFTAENSSTIDYESIAASYTGTAVYTTSASSSKVTGYITKALYKGEISKSIVDKTYYSVIFISAEPVTLPEPLPISEPEPETNITEEEAKPPFELPEVFLPVFLTLLTITAVAGVSVLLLYAILLFNVTIYNQNKDGRGFTKVARIKLNNKDEKNPVIDLEVLNSKKKMKLNSELFVIELSEKISKELNGKEVIIRYGTKEIRHTVRNDEGYRKYQFEVDFKE